MKRIGWGVLVFLAGCAGGPSSQPQTGSSASVVTLPSGLRYEELAPGDGDTALPGDFVLVHYTGWLKDGTMFDTSHKRGQPFRFQLGARQVIAGWDEGVAGMRVGGKRKLIIPPALGYGPEGSPPVIPPNAELTFEVELVRVLRPR